MEGLNRFLEESPVSERVSLPAHIVMRELALSSSAVKRIMESGSLASLGGHVCDLEIGGRRVASGRIVRKRGIYFFKTAATFPTSKDLGGKPTKNGRGRGSLDPLLLAAFAIARPPSLPGDVGNLFLLNLLDSGSGAVRDRGPR